MKNEIILRRIAVLLVVSGWALGAVITAQEPGAAPPSRNGGGQFAGMQRVAGEVTAVSGTTLTVKTEEGATLQIVTTDNTRVMKGRGTAVKVAELKVGDGVTAAGNMDAPNKTLHAAIVFTVDAADVKKLKDNLGKTYITGKVTAIDADNAKMTLKRPDGVEQTIGFDETTSFKRGRPGRGGGLGMGGDSSASAAAGGESITLADIKVGDTVGGQGSVKSGVFVPAVLTVATPGQPRHRAGETPGNAAPVGTPAPAAPGPGPGC